MLQHMVTSTTPYDRIQLFIRQSDMFQDCERNVRNQSKKKTDYQKTGLNSRRRREMNHRAGVASAGTCWRALLLQKNAHLSLSGPTAGQRSEQSCKWILLSGCRQDWGRSGCYILR
eukprot:gnl/TRDRNA2_/TRDRNA2_137986_c0_seq1.p1 gnl/TRDRNA2_/TRDRNA2_137986_c0~~gnl/TRDRNA2_/TRDRNA2_137986_c0_seq1.p1  ORF type:complete len:116 (-),score=8.54 gnl/TRDRNA2_/TRDRNA2_137986_c0_seq1:116-463(-)